MKKFYVVIVAVLLLVLPASSIFAEATEETGLKLSLAEAVNYALEHNPNVQLARVTLEEAEKKLDEAENNQDNMEDAVDAGYTPSFEENKALDYYPDAAKRGFDLAEVNLDYTKRSVRLAVEQAYYNVLSAEIKLQANEAAYRRMIEQQKNAEVQFAAKTVAKNDLLNAQVQVAKAQVDLNTAKKDLAVARMELNRALGVELNKQYRLTTKLAYVPAGELNLEEIEARAGEKDAELAAARVVYENSKDAFEYTAKYYTPNVYKYREAKLDADRAEVSYQEAKKDLQLRIFKAYQNLLVADDNYNMLVKSVEQARESMRLAEVRYRAGVTTNLEVLQASEVLRKQELLAAQALHNFNLLKTQFSYLIFY